ncbi:hypothetical protein ACTWQB_15695 [Piscibacillus sp. B03]|uniref:hypothetical protein n=1 Tax=Piscibacillus sp. B03 TaxID=3457430 RepID=UPI003FCE5D86
MSSQNELKAVKNKIQELESKKSKVFSEIQEIKDTIDESIEYLLIGKISEEDIEKAKNLLEEKEEELKETDSMLQKAYQARNKLAREKFIPFAKERRKKNIQEIQTKYDRKIQDVQKARNEFLKQLAELGQIKQEVGKANDEFNSVLNELGLESETYGSTIKERVVVPIRFTSDKDAIGVKEQVQKQTYSSGNVPHWVNE